MTKEPSYTNEYHSRKIAEGKLILFTGAGFSMGATDYSGKNLPSGYGLAKELWEIAFPGEPYFDV